jgi:hypothetical protein
MAGIRQYTVHFARNPDVAQVKEQLLAVTGLPLVFEQFGQDEHGMALTVSYPKQRLHPSITLDWHDVDIRASKNFYPDSVLSRSANKYQLRCVGVESSALGNPGYLDGTALYVLIQLGGQMEEELFFPAWIGKPWADIWPTSHWKRLKAYLHIFLYGTLPD